MILNDPIVHSGEQHSLPDWTPHSASDNTSSAAPIWGHVMSLNTDDSMTSVSASLTGAAPEELSLPSRIRITFALNIAIVRSRGSRAEHVASLGRALLSPESVRACKKPTSPAP